MNAEIALRVADVSYAYAGRKALDHVSFDVRRGRVTSLLGPNGAGKSTLFALITRLFDTREGRIEIVGQDLKHAGAAALAPLGVVFQSQTLDIDLSVRQNLRYFAQLRGLSITDADQRIARELARFNMGERLHEKVRNLNGGHRRRVEIARCLMHDPQVILLDEPTVGLDVPSRKAIVEYVHSIAVERHIAVLWATHLIDEIWPQDDLIVLHKGRVLAGGPSPEVIASTGAGDLETAFAQMIATHSQERAA